MKYILGMTSLKSRHSFAQVNTRMCTTSDDRQPFLFELYKRQTTEEMKIMIEASRGYHWSSDVGPLYSQEWLESINCRNCTNRILLHWAENSVVVQQS